MAIVQKTDPRGVDAVIDALQQYLFTNLTGLGGGWSSYECYPRANKNIKGDNLIPEVSKSIKEYIEVLFDDTFNATSFFLVDDSPTFNNDERLVLQDVELIFQVNLPNLFPLITDRRADEDLHEQVLQLLIDNDELIVDTQGYTTGVDKVYSELRLRNYSKDGIDLDDMSEFHVVKFRFTVTWDADDCDIEFSPACNPVSVSINSDPFAVFASGSAPNIEVRDTANALVGFDDSGIWRVPAAGAVITTALLSTGQENSFLTGDDGDRFINGDYASVNAADISDYYTLVLNNEFNHNHRLVGDTGGFMDEVTGSFFDKDGIATTKALAFPNDILRDYAWRRRWFLLRSGARSWDNCVTLTLTESKGGEVGWFCPNKAEYESLTSNSNKTPTYIDNRLFNWSTINMWASTTNKINTAQAHRLGPGADSWTAQAKTQLNANAFVKLF